MYKLINGCRACGYGKNIGPNYIKSAPTEEKLQPVFDLGIQPLANDFKDVYQEYSGYAPLKVMFCPRCTLAQLSVVVKPEILYLNYPYVTSRSQMMRDHFVTILDDIRSEQKLGSVLEIGSNDGFFLKTCKETGAEFVLGVDPADNLAKIAEQDGVPTLPALFSSSVADMVRSKCCDPDIIVARHVLCHVDDWKDFVFALEAVTSSHTLIFIEVPYVADLLKNVEFDSIYHEHLSYLSLKAIQALLIGSNLHLHKIIPYSIHGGAIGIMLRCDDSGIEVDQSVVDALQAEGMAECSWRHFSDDAWGEIRKLKTDVSRFIAEGKSVCGYGASAKSTVWINACGFTRKQIKFVTDTTPQKQYKFIPGTDIPVTDEGALIREMPDIAILFAWNYANEIIAKEQVYVQAGGRFIIPHENLAQRNLLQVK